MEEHLKPMFDKLTGEDGFISGLMDLVSALWDILVGL